MLEQILYFQKHILAEINGPLTLGLDDVDKVFKYPYIVEDFLGMLRVWHDRGQQEAHWQTLQLIIVHSQEYTPSNINRSPFNVGLPIKLADLTLAQVQDLSQRHGLTWNTKLSHRPSTHHFRQTPANCAHRRRALL
ncbi:MAG: hypothetical protein B6247_15585 [Candidatus Parabeggiatoa sp. nov. 2]|nr:MAG: hypothetical protein B6247_15585 [Beggiatoa sp. 4572_84]